MRVLKVSVLDYNFNFFSLILCMLIVEICGGLDVVCLICDGGGFFCVGISVICVCLCGVFYCFIYVDDGFVNYWGF